MHSSSTFRTFLHGHLLYLHICQYVLIFILKVLSLEVPSKTQGYSSVFPKNASASRLLSVSHILSLHYFIVLAYSRHIGAFFSYETCKHSERFFFSNIWLLQNFRCSEIMPCNWGSPCKNAEVLLNYFNCWQEARYIDLLLLLWAPPVIEIFENDITFCLCCSKIRVRCYNCHGL